VLFTIKASEVSLKCNQLHVLPSKVGSAITGNLMCVCYSHVTVVIDYFVLIDYYEERCV